MIVDEILLLVRRLEVTNKTCNTQLLDDVEDIELAVEGFASLALKLVQLVVRLAAAQAPRTREVLLAAEFPARVLERLAAVASLSEQVVLEFTLAVWHGWVAFTILLTLFNIVVELLGHGVVKVELLVRTEDIAGETQDERQVGTEALEGVAEGLARRAE